MHTNKFLAIPPYQYGLERGCIQRPLACPALGHEQFISTSRRVAWHTCPWDHSPGRINYHSDRFATPYHSSRSRLSEFTSRILSRADRLAHHLCARLQFASRTSRWGLRCPRCRCCLSNITASVDYLLDRLVCQTAYQAYYSYNPNVRFYSNLIFYHGCS